MSEPKSILTPELIKTLEMSRLYAGFGLFTMIWQQFDELLEVIIQREARLGRLHSNVILSGLGFERKASIARSLLALKGDKYKPAISAINKLIGEAQRNFLLHGRVEIGELQLTFSKFSTEQKLVVREEVFDSDKIYSKLNKMLAIIRELEASADLTSKHTDQWDKTQKRLVKRLLKSPKPPSSKRAS